MSNMKTTDHALAVAKAGLNLVPLVGGAIASLLESYVPDAMARSTTKGLEAFRAALDALDNRIDESTVNKDDFAELYNSCRLVWARTTREEKICTAANILTGLFRAPDDPSKASYEELDHFLRCIDSLSIGAISVLKAMHTTVEKTKLGASTHVSASTLSVQFPKWETSFFMSLVAELRAFNLLQVQEAPIRTPAGELLELTPVGFRLVTEFINHRL